MDIPVFGVGVWCGVVSVCVCVCVCACVCEPVHNKPSTSQNID